MDSCLSKNKKKREAVCLCLCSGETWVEMNALLTRRRVSHSVEGLRQQLQVQIWTAMLRTIGPLRGQMLQRAEGELGGLQQKYCLLETIFQ